MIATTILFFYIIVTTVAIVFYTEDINLQKILKNKYFKQKSVS